MIKSKIAGVEIGADFTFFAVVAMFIALDTTGFALMSLGVCLIHETGHLLAMLCLGQKPRSLFFRSGGIKISAVRYSTATARTVTLLAGSGVNIALFFALYFTLPKTDLYPVMFAMLNLVIGLFNLLPIGCLDGNQLLTLFLTEQLSLKHGERICRIIQTIAVTAVVIAGIAAFVYGSVNFTLAAVMLYVLCVDFFSRL